MGELVPIVFPKSKFQYGIFPKSPKTLNFFLKRLFPDNYYSRNKKF